MELTAKQLQGLHEAVDRYKNHEKYVTISGYAGTGKAQPVDTMIPTPNGWQRLGSLKIGDEVFDREGKPTKILNVFPQGQKDVYTLTLSDGRSTKCAADHLWTVYNNDNKFVATTEQLIQNGPVSKYFIPNNSLVEYKEQDYNIDPYIVGTFLGGGGLREQQLNISSDNEDISNIIKELLRAEKVKCAFTEKYCNWIFPRFQTKELFTEYQNELLCDNKRIPAIYKNGSSKQRFSLIQGILDTGGYICKSKDNNDFHIYFSSTSYSLITDIKEVLHSLGYSSFVIVDKGCFKIDIDIPNEEKPKLFRMKKKKNVVLKNKNHVNTKNNYDKIGIAEIAKENYKTEMVCIYVDNPEHLYLTNDFIVTHNTTLVKFIIEALDVPRQKVSFVSFTGKASEVLRKAGCDNAMTMHKLLYRSAQNEEGDFTFALKNSIDYSIIVVDEVSMVPKQMIRDLMTFPNIFCIFLGDPFQLPAIFPDSDNQLLEQPHVFLDEIMRQAKESDIIRTSMKIRAREGLTTYHGQDINIVKSSDLCTGMYDWADEILCATNNVRFDINKCMKRNEANLNPKVGDKIICLQNKWETVSINDNPILNGTIGEIVRLRFEQIDYKICGGRSKYGRKFYKFPRQIISTPTIIVDLQTDDGDIYKDLRLDFNSIVKNQKTLTPLQEYQANHSFTRKGEHINPEAPIEASFGWAITTHRAQGSQWNKVTVIEEGFPFSKEEHARWLYTAVTRASKKCTLVLR